MTTNAELRALAEKATPGPWSTDNPNREMVVQPNDDGPYIYIADCDSFSDHGKIEDNAAYIAAAHPARIIELLDELDEHEGWKEERDALKATPIYRGLEIECSNLRAKLEQYEQPTRELVLKAEPQQTLTSTLISLNLAQADNRDLRAKLEIAMRALDEIASGNVGLARHHASGILAQLKGQP